MMGLIAKVDSSPTRQSASEDQSAHSGSSVMTSRRTLVSTSVNMLLPRQRHDLIGRHSAFQPSSHAADDHLAACHLFRLLRLHQVDGIAFDDEVDFRVGKEAELLADFLRNRNLPLGSDPHDDLAFLLLPVRTVP